jgi:3-hydroxyisobutyrate dehydrogenase-like beta-hydroxyacid dehydrogenase
MTDLATVGLIGAGTMGGRVLTRLIESGCRVVVRDIAPEAARRASENGGEVVTSPAEVARRAELVLMSLPMPADVQTVVTGDEGLLTASREGMVIVDLSTVDPQTTRHNAAEAAGRGVGYLDAPVLGRPAGCGRWTLPVGGGEGHLARARPVLELLATRIIHVGMSGAGNTVKLLNNLMFSAINAVTAEVLAICAACGMDAQVFVQTVADSGAATVSNLFRELGPKILARDFSPAFSIDLLHKDVRLGLEMASRARVPTIISTAGAVLIEMARARGLGPEDTGAVVKVFEALAAP